ncbi:MAG TPA: DUF378 domain-containing protein [Verrucomicrobiae bacterium]|nr:DUF378 domain-containing protein [Verrucomicrobiae bacterium]
MQELTVLDWISLILVIIGALNWGLVGVFKLDLVKAIFGEDSVIARIIFALVGIAGIYLIFLSMQLVRQTT